VSTAYQIEAFYVELLASDWRWPERRTRKGQALLVALREYVAMANDSTDEEAQNTCEELALRVRLERRDRDEDLNVGQFIRRLLEQRSHGARDCAPDPHEPRNYNDADGVETMADQG